MVSDDPESFADLDGLDGHECTISAPGGISCKGENNISSGAIEGEGTGPNNSGTNGQGSSQDTQAQAQAQANQNANQAADQQQAQNQNPDPVQQVTQAMADAKQKAIADQNRPSTEQDKAKALVEAGKMGDAGVKAGLVVVGGEAVIATGVVAAPTVAAATTQAASAVNTTTLSLYVRTTTALGSAGTAIANALGPRGPVFGTRLVAIHLS